MAASKKESSDPLHNPQFKPPGLAEKLREIFLGAVRPLDCVQIEVTSFCPGKCIYCPHTSQAQNWRSRHMAAETFAKLWPLLKLTSRVHLQGWGEPLLQPRFFDFAALARRAGCQVSSTSCGLVMNENVAERICQSGMDMIAFSLAGTDAASNAARKAVDFAKVEQAIAQLQRAMSATGSKLEIHLAYIMLADRLEAARKLPELMARLNVPVTIVSTLDYLARPEDAALAILPDESDKIEAAREILEDVAERAGRDGRLVHYALPGQEAVAHAGGCRENISKTLYIDADGNISPCIYLNVPGNDKAEKRRIFGNVAQKDPLKIWTDPEFRAFRKQLAANSPDTVCQNCPKRREVYVERAVRE